MGLLSFLGLGKPSEPYVGMRGMRLLEILLFFSAEPDERRPERKLRMGVEQLAEFIGGTEADAVGYLNQLRDVKVISYRLTRESDYSPEDAEITIKPFPGDRVLTVQGWYS